MPVRRKRIQSIVRTLLTESGLTEAPVPVQRIARAQGARIFLEALEGNLSGFLYRDKDEAVIGVNTHHPKVRQNFTMAHELGHLLLHDQEQFHVDRDFRVKFRNEQSSQGTDETEKEANLFAAELLMPREFLQEDLKGLDSMDLLDDVFLNDLARKYGVSTQALIYRLVYLGYLQEVAA